MLIKEIPFLRLVVPLGIGILSGVYIHPSGTLLTILIPVILAGMAISLLFNKNLVNVVYGSALSVVLVFAGHILYRSEKQKLSTLAETRTEFICTVSDYPETRGKSVRVTVKLRHCTDKTTASPLHGSLLIYFRNDPKIFALRPGDFLRLKCTPIGIVNKGNPDEFDYRFYMENRGIKYYAFSETGDITGFYSPDHRSFLHRALIVREGIISMYENRGIKGETLAIVAAITLGEKSLLDEEQKQNFSKAGIMHLMAVSGLHAVILSMIVFNLLFFMKGRLSPLRSLTAVICLWAFAFVTGFTPSVVRATIMFTFFQSGKLMGRNLNSLNSVLASAFLLLLIRPSVLFDTGFLLSYSAVIFIICFYRDIYLKLDFRNSLADRIWQSAAVSTVATAGTLPLTISVFNRFPTYFLLTNIIIVPIGTSLIILGCLVLLTYPLESVSMLLAAVLRIMTGITGTLTEKAASLPLSTFENLGLLKGEAILLSLFIFLFLRFFADRKKIRFIYPSAALLALIIFGTVKEIRCRVSGELIVYNTPGFTTVGIRNGKILNLYSDSQEYGPEVLKHCATRGLKPVLTPTGERDILLKACENRILITRTLTKSLLEYSNPDFIIIRGPAQRPEGILQSPASVKAVIITDILPPGNSSKGNSYRDFSANIYYVRKSGSVRIKI